jgi:hypothetical protein
MRKFLLAIVILLLTTLSTFARAKVQGIASQGGWLVVTAGMSSSTRVVRSFPNCTVTVYFTGTTNPASIFSDNVGTPKSNPFMSGGDASYFFYIDDGRYDIRFSGSGVDTPFTLFDILVAEAGGGGGGGSGVSSFNGRTDIVLPLANDYTWAMINKAVSSLGDLTTRSASDLNTGTLPNGVFPAILPAISGINLTNLDASDLSAGTIPDTRFPATLPIASGTNLTNLNASAISSGTLSDARLSSNVPLKNSNNTFTNTNIFNLSTGIGTPTPRRTLDILATASPQLRLTFTDNSIFTDLHTNASGNFIVSPTASITFDPTGNQVDPVNNFDINLGQLSKKYLAIHAAELFVETLVAQNTVATIGGRVIISPSTMLIADLSPASTTVDVKHNSLANNDNIYMEANGKVEHLLVTSAATVISGGFRYSITRNLDGTGADQWFAGDAIVETGPVGGGFIDAYSISGVKSGTQAGPTIVGNIRNSLTYNDWSENWAIGNLKGLYGYGTDTMGVGLGPYLANTSHLTIDSTNGIRMFDGLSTVRAQIAADGSGFLGNTTFIWDASGNITMAGWTVNSTRLSNSVTHVAAGFDVPAGAMAWFGQSSTGYRGLSVRDASNRQVSVIANDSTIFPYVQIFDGTRARVILGGLNNSWCSDGSTNSMGMKICDSAGNLLAAFHDLANIISGWTISATKISSTGIDIVSGANAYLSFGTTPPTSASTGTGIFLNRTGLYGLLTNVVQAKFDATTGAITAGAGAVVLDVNGITINAPTTFSDPTSYKFKSGATTISYFTGQMDASFNQVFLSALSQSGRSSSIQIDANSPTGISSFIDVINFNNGVRKSAIRLGGNTTGWVGFEGQTTIDTVVDGSIGPTTSAALAIDSTTGALLIPRMTTVQRDALTPQNGMILYCTDCGTGTFQGRANGAWVNLH